MMKKLMLMSSLFVTMSSSEAFGISGFRAIPSALSNVTLGMMKKSAIYGGIGYLGYRKFRQIHLDNEFEEVLRIRKSEWYNHKHKWSDQKSTKLETVKKLVAKGANVNCKTSDGTPMLHFIIRPQAYYDLDQELANYLLSAGIDINCTDDHGKTALDLANLWDSYYWEKWLKEHGGKYSSELV